MKQLLLCLLLCFAAPVVGQQGRAPEKAASQTNPPAPPFPPPGFSCASWGAGVEHGNALEAFCDWVLSFREQLPNILSDEKMNRSVQTLFGYQFKDTITMTAHYFNNNVEYSDLAINGKSTKGSVYDLDGSWSTGEMGVVLEGLLADIAKSKFKFAKRIYREKKPVLVFECDVPHTQNMSWALQTGGKKVRTLPGFRCKLLLDETTNALLQVERVTTDIDWAYPLKQVSTVTKYEDIRLGDGSDFVLPVSSESVSCAEKVEGVITNCMRNNLTFTNWRKFGAEHRVIPNPPPPNVH